MKQFLRISLVCMVLLTCLGMAGAANASPILTGLFDAYTLAGNDDGSTGLVNIGFSANLYGTSYSQLYVNNNGNVTFNSTMSTYTPFGISESTIPIIAPFFADVDTRTSQVVSYGQNTVNGQAAFGVDWFNVGYYSERDDLLNTFQLILIDRSDIATGDFDIVFNYGQILWETGEASDGINGLGGTSAAVGYSNGAGTYFEFTGSRINGAFLDNGPNALIDGSNVGIDGRYVFEVRNGTVINPPSTVPEPSSLLLLGLGLIGLVGLGRKRLSR